MATQSLQERIRALQEKIEEANRTKASQGFSDQIPQGIVKDRLSEFNKSPYAVPSAAGRIKEETTTEPLYTFATSPAPAKPPREDHGFYSVYEDFEEKENSIDNPSDGYFGIYEQPSEPTGYPSFYSVVGDPKMGAIDKGDEPIYENPEVYDEPIYENPEIYDGQRGYIEIHTGFTDVIEQKTSNLIDSKADNFETAAFLLAAQKIDSANADKKFSDNFYNKVAEFLGGRTDNLGIGKQLFGEIKNWSGSKRDYDRLAPRPSGEVQHPHTIRLKQIGPVIKETSL